MVKYPIKVSTNESKRGKTARPVLLLSKLPGELGDWLVCIISTKKTMFMESIDMAIKEIDEDFVSSGLKSISIFRVLRIAVINKDIMSSRSGNISNERLIKIKATISKWILKP